MDVAGIISVLSDHGFQDETTSRQVAIINDVVWDVSSREPWPFMEKSISLTFNGSSAIPTNYPTNVASILGMIDTVSGSTLEPIRLEEFRSRHVTNLTETGIPYFYYFLAGVLSVFPIPSSSTTILTSYIHFPAALTSTSTEADIIIPPRFHSIIWYGALAHLYDMEDEPDLATKFQNKFEQKFQTMRNQIWLRQMDRADTIEVIDPEDLYS